MGGKIGIVALVAALLVITSCGRLRVVYEVSDHPVPPRAQNLPLRQIRNAIFDAAYARNWVVKDIGNRQIKAIYARRRYKAVVIITYGRKRYSIAYHDSQFLKYNGNLIHRTYNRWVRNLDNNIQRFLQRNAMRQKPLVQS